MNTLNWKFTAMLFVILAGFTSCDDDDDYYITGNNWISYGNLEKTESNGKAEYSIRRDDNNRLIIAAGQNINNDRKAFDGMRVFCTYSIIESQRQPVGLEGYMDYYVYLHRISDVLTKEPVRESFINEDKEHRQDSIGNDPINVTEAWFGGKYLNVEFNLPVKDNKSGSHMINLVREDITLHNDTVYLTLRHNAFGDCPASAETNTRSSQFRWVWGNVSFDLTSILPENAASVPVKLIWKAYKKNSFATETITDCGLYAPGKKITKAGADGLNSIPQNLKEHSGKAIFH